VAEGSPSYGNARTDLRRVLDAPLYIGCTGCQWDALPHGYPPRSTCYDWFRRRCLNGTFEAVLLELARQEREKEGREASPTMALVDSQSVKSGATRGGKGLMASGFDGGKMVNGAKRHAMTDSLGNLLGVVVTAANVGDRAGARLLLALARPLQPFIELVLGDSGYSGPELAADVAAATGGSCRFEVEKRHETATGFKPARRWPVERLFAFVGLCRRLAKNYERYAETAEAWFMLAFVRILLGRTPETALP